MALREYIELLVAKQILVKENNEYLEAADNNYYIEVNCPVEQTWVEMCSIYNHTDGNFYVNLTVDDDIDESDAMTLDDIRISKVLTEAEIMSL